MGEDQHLLPDTCLDVGYLDLDEMDPQWVQALDLLDYSDFEPQLISYQSVRDAAQMSTIRSSRALTSIRSSVILTEEANLLQAELME